MKTAFGGLNWTPAEFWTSTLTEFFLAVEGRNEAMGVKEKEQAPRKAELADLFKRYGQ